LVCRFSKTTQNTSRSPKKNNPTKEETVEKTFNKELETKLNIYAPDINSLL
jgi:hypothetical protein